MTQETKKEVADFISSSQQEKGKGVNHSDSEAINKLNRPSIDSIEAMSNTSHSDQAKS
jgi:hypothetical protein